MNRIFKLKTAVAILLLLTMLTFIFPIIKFDDLSISLLDMAGTSSDIKELMDEFGTSSEFINNEVHSYFIFGMILLCLPIIEMILLFVIRGKIALTVGVAGAPVNYVLGFIFYDKINSTISLINEAISFLSMDMKIEIVAGTIAFWCVVHSLVAAISLFGLLKGERFFPANGRFQPVSSRRILPEEISHSPNRSYSPPNKGIQKQRVPNREAARQYTQEQTPPPFATAPVNRPVQKPFYGGVTGMNNIYQGKIRLLNEGEKLVLGADGEDGELWLEPALDGIGYCVLSYDSDRREYRLKPLRKSSVLLKSGQPLGKDRTYCLPRGTVITLQDKKYIFQLA